MAYSAAETTKYAEGTHFKLDLSANYPPIKVKETSIDFSSDATVVIEPGKCGKINSGFYIHQDGEHRIHFEPLQNFSFIQMIPNQTTSKLVGPMFKLKNYSDFKITIPAGRIMFRATFSPLGDVDLFMDMPVGTGAKELEDRENDLYALGLLRVKEAREERERDTVIRETSKIIGEAVELLKTPSPVKPPSGGQQVPETVAEVAAAAASSST